MAVVFCKPGCTCGRHRHTTGYSLGPRSLEHRRALAKAYNPNVIRSTPCAPNCTCLRHNPPPRTEEHRANLSKALLGRHFPHHEGGRRRWMGAAVGDTYAAILCPLGYIREFIVYFNRPNARRNGLGQRAVMDFGHPTAKVDIELDGPYHQRSESDSVRDEALRALGWRVIRIKHD